MTREEMQDYALDHFLSLSIRRGLIMIGTGGGKTRIAMMAIKVIQPLRVMFLSDSIIGRDVTLPDELEKWGLSDYKDKTEFVTYQLAYKWKKDKRDLTGTFVIADEVDFAMTRKYGQFFKEYDDLDILGMTGYSPDYKLWEFSDYLPLVVDIPVIELQKAGIVNKYKIIFMQYTLGKEKNRVITYKKSDGTMGTFKQSENGVYLHMRKKEKMHYAKLKEATDAGDMIEAAKCQYYLDNILPRMRADFLITLETSADIARAIAQGILSNPNNKVISFSHRTEQADKISHNNYHGKNTKESNADLFSKFNSGEIRDLALCNKINRTANMVGLNNCIMESYMGDEVAFIQRSGRMLRLPVDQVANIFVLLPYYIPDPEDKEGEEGEEVEEKEIVAKPTVMVKWAQKMMKSIDFSYTEFETRNLTPYKMSK